MQFSDTQTTIIQRPVPARYRDYLIRGRPVELIERPEGELLMQRLQKDGFLIQLQVLSCRQRYRVTPYIADSRVVLFYMLAGNFTYVMWQGRKIEARAGSYCRFIFIPQPQSQPALRLPAGFYASFHIEFSPGYFESLVHDARNIGAGDRAAYRRTAIDPGIRSLLHAIRHAPHDEPAQMIYLDIQVKRLLFHYLRNRGTRSAASLRLVEEIVHYIRGHLNGDLGIAGLSARFYLSSSTLQRYFMHYYNMSVHRFVLRERMTWARELLQNGETIRRAATETGFDELASFTRSFTRYFGRPPSSFRRR